MYFRSIKQYIFALYFRVFNIHWCFIYGCELYVFVLHIAIKAGGQTILGQSTFYEVLHRIKAAIFSISRNNYSAMSSIGFPLWLRGKFVLFGHKNCNIKSCHIIPFWFNVDCFQNVILFAIHFEQAIGHFYSARFFYSDTNLIFYAGRVIVEEKNYGIEFV